MDVTTKTSTIKIRPTDEMLVCRAQRGDLEAFNEVFTRHVDLAFEYAVFLTGSRALAEEVSLRAFLELYQNLKRYRFQTRLEHEILRYATIASQEILEDADLSQVADQEAQLEPLKDLDFFERSIMVLIQKYGIESEQVSHILGCQPESLPADIAQDLPQAPKTKHVSHEIPVTEYRALLNDKIAKMHKRRQMRLIGWSVLLLLIFSPAIYLRYQVKPVDAIGEFSASRQPMSEAGLQPHLIRAGKPHYLSLTSITEDKIAQASPGRSQINNYLSIVPQRGKVLHVEYEVMAQGTSATLSFFLKPLDSGTLDVLSLWLRSPDSGTNSNFVGFQFTSEIGLVLEKGPFPVPTEWTQIEFPLSISDAASIKRIDFIFHKGRQSEGGRGLVLIDQVSLESTR